MSEKVQTKLIKKRNNIFKGLQKKKKIITKREKNYFKFNFKNATNVGRLYCLPKIHSRLSNVLGRPVISNCGNHKEEVLEFLEHYLQPVKREGFLDQLKY